jgi:guanosine-3',5'-bis(diphosphate) 3'-pyrophosphohydrolase
MSLPKSLADKIAGLKTQDQSLIEKAFVFAKKKHNGQKRLSGSPYLLHLIRTASYLIQDKYDAITIASGLLHDTIEDTATSKEEISQNFGEEIAEIVEGVTKISQVKIKDKNRVFSGQFSFIDQVDNYRKLLVASASNPKIISVKLYDRLDNILTIKHIPEHKQKFYARETIDIYAAIAERLGMGSIKGRLEDAAFPWAYPEEYLKFKIETRNIYKNPLAVINNVIPDIKRKLSDLKVKFYSVNGREKYKYSLYKKIRRKGSAKGIYDIVALRIIVDSVEDCYRVLGIVHTMYEPLPRLMDDYIARPKNNSYRSLHTTVRNKDNKIFEIQIRTKEMHESAEHGHLAHWNYKNNQNNEKTSAKNAKEWFEALDKLKDIRRKSQFLEELKNQLFSEKIFVFTPKGDLINLPINSTPIDFAYRIHSSIGNKCVGAKINNRIMPLSTKLQSRDVVEILTSKNSSPSQDWLNFVVTTYARNRIKSFAREKTVDKLSEYGLKIVSEQISKFGLPDIDKDKSEKIVASSKLPYKGLDRALAAIAERNLKPIKFLKTLYPKFSLFERKKERKTSEQISAQHPSLISIRHDFAKCCKPTPKDSDVVGYLGKEHIIRIHKKNCKRLTTLDHSRFIEL